MSQARARRARGGSSCASARPVRRAGAPRPRAPRMPVGPDPARRSRAAARPARGDASRAPRDAALRQPESSTAARALRGRAITSTSSTSADRRWSSSCAERAMGLGEREARLRRELAQRGLDARAAGAGARRAAPARARRAAAGRRRRALRAAARDRSRGPRAAGSRGSRSRAARRTSPRRCARRARAGAASLMATARALRGRPQQHAHLAEELAGAVPRDHALAALGVADQLDLPGLDHVQRVACLALVEDQLAGRGSCARSTERMRTPVSPRRRSAEERRHAGVFDPAPPRLRTGSSGAARGRSPRPVGQPAATPSTGRLERPGETTPTCAEWIAAVGPHHEEGREAGAPKSLRQRLVAEQHAVADVVLLDVRRAPRRARPRPPRRRAPARGRACLRGTRSASGSGARRAGTRSPRSRSPRLAAQVGERTCRRRGPGARSRARQRSPLGRRRPLALLRAAARRPRLAASASRPERAPTASSQQRLLRALDDLVEEAK